MLVGGICAVLLFSESKKWKSIKRGELGSSEQQNEGKLLVCEKALGLQPGRRLGYADLEHALHVTCQISY